MSTEHHIIDWEEATVIGRESDLTTRWIMEAVKIRQEGRDVVNRRGDLPALPHILLKQHPASWLPH